MKKTVIIGSIILTLALAGCSSAGTTNQTSSNTQNSTTTTTKVNTNIKPKETPAQANVTTDFPLPDGYKIVWRENFKGTEIDKKSWRINPFAFRKNVIMGAESAFIGPSGLSIRSWTDDNGQHHSGGIDTKGKREFTYGLFNAKIKFFGAPGQQTAFWLQSANTGKYIGDQGKHGDEIDVMEFRQVSKAGKNISDLLTSTIHYDGYGADHKQIQKTSTAPMSMEGTWHNYSVLWTPTSYKFFFDGQQYAEIDDAVSQSPEYIILSGNVNNGGNWNGYPPAGGYGSLATSNVGMDVAEVWVAQKQ